MKMTLITGAAIVALIGSAAFAEEDLLTFDAAALAAEADGVVPFAAYGGDYLRASDLLGAGVYTDDELNARIDDIALAEGGSIQSVIVNVGSFLGMGGDETSVAPIRMAFSRTNDGVRAVTSLSRGQLDDAADAEDGYQVEVRPSTDPNITGWSLAALIDASVDTEDEQNSAAIDDVLFDNEGHAQYAILRTGGASGLNGRIGFGGKLTAVSFSDLSLSVVDNEIDVNVAKTTAEVADRPAVDFSAS